MTGIHYFYADPPDNCQLNVKKLKNLTFKKKIDENCHFFNKIQAKMSSFWQFFDIQMAFSGGSGDNSGVFTSLPGPRKAAEISKIYTCICIDGGLLL